MMDGGFSPPPDDGKKSPRAGGRGDFVQHLYTTTPNSPPPSGVLTVGELGLELADPVRIWVGVPTSLNPTGRRVIYDSAVGGGIPEPPGDGLTYGRQPTLWVPTLPLSGGTVSGDIIIKPTYGGAAFHLDSPGPGWPEVTWNAQVAGIAAGYFQSSRYGKTRWSVEFGGTQIETGVNNTGTDFLINRFDDDGQVIYPSPLGIVRGTGVVTIATTLMLGADPTAPMQAATMQWVGNNYAPIIGGGYVAKAGDTMSGTLHLKPGAYLQFDDTAGGTGYRYLLGGDNVVSAQSTNTDGSARLLWTLQTLQDGAPFRHYANIQMVSGSKLFLYDIPTSDPEAASKKYVDGVITRAGGPFLPLTAGPGAALTGQLYLPHVTPTVAEMATAKFYVDAADQNLQAQISAVVSGNLVFYGQLDVANDVVHYKYTIDIPDSPMPPPTAVPKGGYIIVTTGGIPPTGTNIPPLPPGTPQYVRGDWFISDGEIWIFLPTGLVYFTADAIEVDPPIQGTVNVQDTLLWLDANKLNIAGGTLTGQLYSPFVPSTGPQVANKAYVDNQITSGAVTSFNTRTGAVVLTPADVFAATGLLRTGGTMTGDLLLNSDPTADLGAATKQYVDRLNPANKYLLLTGGTMSGGISFGAETVASNDPTDTSRHITLWQPGFGFSITGNRLNYNVGVGSGHVFLVGGADVVSINSVGLSMGGGYDIYLARDPSQPMHAVNKAWIEANYSTNSQGDARWVNVTGDTMTGPLLVPTGTAALPSLGSSVTAGTGIFFPGATIHFTTAGTDVLIVSGTNLRSLNPYRAPDGITGLPAYTFASEPSSGLYRPSAGNIAMTVGGTQTTIWTAASFFSAVPIQAGDWLIAAKNTSVTPNPGGSGIISWNRTQGGGEVNFYNTFNAGFDWRRVTGAGTEAMLAALNTSALALYNLGISYNGLAGGGNTFGFVWNGGPQLWVDGNPQGTLARMTDLMPDAPGDSNLYGRMNGAWSLTSKLTYVAGNMSATGPYFNPNTDILGWYVGLYNVQNQGPGGAQPGWPQTQNDNTAMILTGFAANADWPTRIMFGGRYPSTGGIPLWFQTYDFIWHEVISDKGGKFQGGISFGNRTGSSPTDLSQHIQLWAPNYGFSITGGTLNIVAGGNINCYPNGTMVTALSDAGLALQKGDVTLFRDPTAAMHATTKQYVDAKFLPIAGGNYVAKTGDMMSGNLGITTAVGVNAALTLDAASGSYRLIQSGTRGSTRWQVQMGNSVAESGTAVGSDFLIARFDNAGNYLGAPFQINRASGAVSIAQSLTVAGDTWANNLYIQGAYGIYYTGPSGIQPAWIGFGWNGSFPTLYVNGGYQYQLASTDWVGTNFATMSWTNTYFKPASEYTPNQVVDYNSNPSFFNPYVRGSLGIQYSNFSSTWIAFGWNGRVQCWLDGGNAYVELRTTADYIPNQSVDNGSYPRFGSLMLSGQTIYLADNQAYYFNRTTDGWWQWVANGTPILQIHESGVAYIKGGLRIKSSTYFSTDILGDGFSIWGDGGGRVIQFTTDNWKLLWNPNFYFFDNNGHAMFGSEGGEFGSWGNMHAYYFQSDERLKNNIEPYTRGLKEIRKLRPITFTYTGKGTTELDNGSTRTGLSAQATQLVMPEIVFEMPEPAHDPTRPPYPNFTIPGQLSMDTQPLLYTVINAIKELAEQNEALVEQNTALMARLEQLEQRMH